MNGVDFTSNRISTKIRFDTCILSDDRNIAHSFAVGDNFSPELPDSILGRNRDLIRVSETPREDCRRGDNRKALRGGGQPKDLPWRGCGASCRKAAKAQNTDAAWLRIREIPG